MTGCTVPVAAPVAAPPAPANAERPGRAALPGAHRQAELPAPVRLAGAVLQTGAGRSAASPATAAAPPLGRVAGNPPGEEIRCSRLCYSGTAHAPSRSFWAVWSRPPSARWRASWSASPPPPTGPWRSSPGVGAVLSGFEHQDGWGGADRGLVGRRDLRHVAARRPRDRRDARQGLAGQLPAAAGRRDGDLRHAAGGSRRTHRSPAARARGGPIRAAPGDDRRVIHRGLPG